MNRSRSIAAALLILIATALVGGCGDSSESVSASELAQRGDQICREEQSRFAEIQAQPPSNATEAANQTRDVTNASEDAVSSLRDMQPPEDLQTNYDLYLKARDAAIDQMKQGEDAAQNQDSGAYGSAQEEVARTALERQKLARALGFRVCSDSPAMP